MSSNILNTVFNETYPTSHDLQESFNDLEMTYLSHLNTNNEDIQYSEFSNNEEIEEIEEIIHAVEILSKEQVDKFKKIYNKISIDKSVEDEDIDFEEQQINEDLNNYINNLKQSECCKCNCLKTVLNYDRVLTRYKCFRELFKMQQDIFLTGVLSSCLKPDKTAFGEMKKKLTMNYLFDGIKICEKAFKCIYGIGETRWKNLRRHYIDNDIMTRKSALMGKTSNNIISSGITNSFIYS